MSIIRTYHDKENPYVQVNKFSLWDKRLSLAAVGLWTRLLSKPDDWEVSVAHIQDTCGIGREKAYKLLEELEREGYAYRFQEKVNRRFGGCVTFVFETKKTPEEIKEIITKTGFPSTAFPTSTNRTLLNTDITNSSSFQSEEKSKQKREPSASPPPLDDAFKERFEGKIKISQENYDRLLSKFNLPSLIEDYAERLYRWSFNNESAFKKKKRHDMVIEDWIEKDLRKEEGSKGSKGVSWEEKSLNELQIKNWRENKRLVEQLKDQLPKPTRGLNFYLKAHILKDSIASPEPFDISGLINPDDFKRILLKHLKINEVKDG